MKLKKNPLYRQWNFLLTSARKTPDVFWKLLLHKQRFSDECFCVSYDTPGNKSIYFDIPARLVHGRFPGSVPGGDIKLLKWLNNKALSDS